METCETCNGTGETPNLTTAYRRDGAPIIAWEDCAACGGYGAPQPPEHMRHWQALVAEAARVGWPTSYERDLTQIDRVILQERDPSLPFGWILREMGTHLFFPEWRQMRGWSSIAECFGREPGHRFYRWDGRTLREFPDVLAFERWIWEQTGPKCGTCDGTGERDLSYRPHGRMGWWCEHKPTCQACKGTGNAPRRTTDVRS